MSISARVALRLGFVCLITAATAARAADERPYREARYEQGELKYINGLPVLIVAGTPEEMGEQKAALTGEAVAKLTDYPRRLFKLIGREDQWPKIVRMSRQLVPQFPADHLRELDAFADKSNVAREVGLVGNTMADTYRGGFGCSSLIVQGKRSATEGPLFGRNLDFFTLGLIEEYSLVTVHRPQGKHAFATIGFPGIFGCISGINDAGLALAVHESFLSKDGAPMFDPKGMPYAFCFRRILEECATVEEAEKLLRSTPRTTLLSLAVCDPRDAAVLEMTPKTVAVRRGQDGVLACTNHFRTRELAVLMWCRRYHTLSKSKTMKTLDVLAIGKLLHAARQDSMTVQTMVFEPAELKLHLAIGACPSSALPLKTLELAPLFAGHHTDR